MQVPLSVPGVAAVHQAATAAPAAATGTHIPAAALASAPGSSISSVGSLGLAGSAAVLKAVGVLAGKRAEEMPAELRISAARAERKKKTEVGGTTGGDVHCTSCWHCVLAMLMLCRAALCNYLTSITCFHVYLFMQERLRQLEEQDDDTPLGLSQAAAAAAAATPVPAAAPAAAGAALVSVESSLTSEQARVSYLMPVEAHALFRMHLVGTCALCRAWCCICVGQPVQPQHPTPSPWRQHPDLITRTYINIPSAHPLGTDARHTSLVLPAATVST
jgi:hypothetical protein